MKRRIDLFEFEDQPWFPAVIREGGTDYLRYFLNATRFYDVTAETIAALCARASQNQILDLCSGGGGGMGTLHRKLLRLNPDLRVALSDKFPNLRAFRQLESESGGRIGFHASPVDAMRLPADLPGVLTMFSAIHHFSPAAITQMLQSAASQRRPLAFFDGGDKSLLTILGIITLQPISFALFTPFFRPFHWQRILFTYLLPAIPLMTMWDGIASIMRLYSDKQLLEIARKAVPGYAWKAGYLRNKAGMKVLYLTGEPG